MTDIKDIKKLLEVVKFAILAHGDQKRKYTGEPYITHPLTVAIDLCDFRIKYPPDYPDSCLEPICAAILHDVVEDTSVTKEMIYDMFKWNISKMVEDLTEVSTPSDGNRAKRKAIDRKHYSKGIPISQDIKVLDLMDNSKSIIEHDPEFAKIYIEEKILLLRDLKQANEILKNRAYKMCLDYYLSTKLKSDDFGTKDES